MEEIIRQIWHDINSIEMELEMERWPKKSDSSPDESLVRKLAEMREAENKFLSSHPELRLAHEKRSFLTKKEKEMKANINVAKSHEEQAESELEQAEAAKNETAIAEKERLLADAEAKVAQARREHSEAGAQLNEAAHEIERILVAMLQKDEADAAETEKRDQKTEQLEEDKGQPASAAAASNTRSDKN